MRFYAKQHRYYCGIDLHARTMYVCVLDQAGKVLRQAFENLTLRWTYRQEMRYLLELTGFQIEAEYSDFAESPPSYGKEQLWLARRL